MQGIVRTAKRVVRTLSASLPWITRRALVRAEFSRGRRDIAVPLGPGTAYVLAASHRVDYFTLYGALIDRHFPADVDGAAVLDIGAHKGYFGLRSLADGARCVHSYEPASQNLSALGRSAAALASWTVEPVAVGADSGRVELHLAPGSWGHSVHIPVGGESVGTETVEMVALRDALKSITRGGAPVVAKINVEGAAGRMILGTVPDDWDAVRLLWVDVEPNDPVGLADLREHLGRCGLRHDRREGHRNLFVR